MDKKPLHQRLITYLLFVTAGFLGVGALLDAISNAITFVTTLHACFASVAIFLGYFAVQRVLKKHAISWVAKDGKTVRLKRLGSKPFFVVLGAILLLWFPRLIDVLQRKPTHIIEPLVESGNHSKDAGQSSGNVISNPEQTEPKLNLQMYQSGEITKFSIVSSGQGQFVVDHLFVKLRGYADCSLRNEERVLGMVSIPNTYLLYISPEFSEYDLVPYTSPGDAGVWKYTGDQSDEYSVEFWFRPYTLFIVSVEVSGKDLLTGNAISLSSEPIELIEVEHGNFGGCLDLESWYQPSMLKEPRQKLYGHDLPLVVRQLLSINLRSSAILEKLDRKSLRAILPQLEHAQRRYKGNTAFEANVDTVREFLRIHRK